MLVGVVKSRAKMARPKRRPPSQWTRSTKRGGDIVTDINAAPIDAKVEVGKGERTISNDTSKDEDLGIGKMSTMVAVAEENKRAEVLKSPSANSQPAKSPPASKSSTTMPELSVTTTRESSEALLEGEEDTELALLEAIEAIVEVKEEGGESRKPTMIRSDSPVSTEGLSGDDDVFPPPVEANVKVEEGEGSVSEYTEDKRPQRGEDRGRNKRRGGSLFVNLKRRFNVQNCNVL